MGPRDFTTQTLKAMINEICTCKFAAGDVGIISEWIIDTSDDVNYNNLMLF